MTTWLHWFSIIAGAASVLSFAAFLYEKLARRQAKLEETRRIWSEISKVKGIMGDVEKDIHSTGSSKRALQAHGALAILLRDLLKEAAQREKRFSLSTIRQWRGTGKLSSDWQEKLALTLLLTEEIDDEELKNEDFSKHRDADAVPTDSPVYHILDEHNKEQC
ncbi:MAG: hypothetical protein QTN59_04670 [Candidatus Electrothrix communis]|nr:MAG: hypothetical protein QTN59_04670 [Candidatus Electrothrix communis]